MQLLRMSTLVFSLLLFPSLVQRRTSALRSRKPATTRMRPLRMMATIASLTTRMPPRTLSWLTKTSLPILWRVMLSSRIRSLELKAMRPNPNQTPSPPQSPRRSRRRFRHRPPDRSGS